LRADGHQQHGAARSCAWSHGRQRIGRDNANSNQGHLRLSTGFGGLVPLLRFLRDWHGMRPTAARARKIGALGSRLLATLSIERGRPHWGRSGPV